METKEQTHQKLEAVTMGYTSGGVKEEIFTLTIMWDLPNYS